MTTTGTAWRIFVTCWLVYCLHFASNSVREIYPALSLGDHFSLRVDEYANLHPDLFETPGRGWHINSNPGASMLAAIPYAVARPVVDAVVDRVNERRRESGAKPPVYDSPWQMARDFHALAWSRGLDVKLGLGALVMQTLCMAPLSALTVVLMYFVLRRLLMEERTAVLLVLLYAFATPLFFRTGTLNHNLLLGHFTFAGFVVLWNPGDWLRWSDTRRATMAGAAAGAGILMDYSGAVTAAALGLYLIFRMRAIRPVMFFALGALAPLSLLWLAQYQSFGHPFFPAQHWMPRVEFSDQGYNGVSLPQLDLIWQNGFDYRFGLFTSCPLLLLALGAPWLRRHPRLRAPELVFVLASVAGLWLFASAVQFGRLQFNTGVRYLAPAFALLFLPAALVLLRLPYPAQLVIGAAALAQGWSMAMYRDVERGLGLLEPMIHIFTEGLQLPFLNVLSRMGYVKVPGVASALILLLGATLFRIWKADLRPLAFLGGAAVVLAAGSSSQAIEHALGRPDGILAWGPALFRVLLAFHGVAVVYFALRSKPVAPAVSREIDRSAIVPLVVLTLIGFALRLWRLDMSLWLDEVLTAANFVKPPLGEIVSSFPFQNQHLLYSIAAHISVNLFGESAASLRLPAVLLGTLSIPALYVLGRQVCTRQVALAAAALMTFSYHHVWFSQNARGYSGILFFAILSTWFWLRALEEDRRNDWIGYAVCTVLGLGIHMTMLFVTAAQILVHAVLLVRGPAREWKTAAFTYVLAGTATLQLYALALPDLIRTGMHEVSLPSEWTNPLWLLKAMVMNFGAGGLGIAVMATGSVVALAGLVSIARRNLAAALAFVLPPVIGAAAVLSSGHNLWPRFFFFAMGFGLLIAIEGIAVSIERVAEWMRQPGLARPAATAACALVVFASALTVPRCYAYPKQDFTGARDFVERSRTGSEPAVAVGTASLVYKSYYAPHWLAAENAGELEALHAHSPSPWLVYTLPIEVKTYRPDIWRVIEREYRPVKIFPGTLQGGGEVYVCRRVTAKSAAPSGGQNP